MGHGEIPGAKRRFAVETPVSWLADSLFFVGAVFVSLGVIMEELAVAKPYAESLPWVLDLWSRYKAWLFGLGMEPARMQLLTVGLLFLIPAAAGIPHCAADQIGLSPQGSRQARGNQEGKGLGAGGYGPDRPGLHPESIPQQHGLLCSHLRTERVRVSGVCAVRIGV